MFFFFFFFFSFDFHNNVPQEAQENYCICGIKFSPFNENDILAHFNFRINDVSWLQIVKKTWCICSIFS